MSEDKKTDITEGNKEEPEEPRTEDEKADEKWKKRHDQKRRGKTTVQRVRDVNNNKDLALFIFFGLIVWWSGYLAGVGEISWGAVQTFIAAVLGVIQYLMPKGKFWDKLQEQDVIDYIKDKVDEMKTGLGSKK